MTTVRDVGKAALQNIEILGVNDTLEDDDGAVALAALVLVAEELGVEGVGIFTELQSNRTLTQAASFTIGTGGDSSATRPMRVLRAFARVNGTDQQVTVRDRGWYMGLPDKTVTSTYPTDLYYDPTVATGTMYVYPVPTASPVLYWDSERQLTANTDLSDTLTIPPGYASLLEYRLTKRLADKYGKTVKAATVDWGEKIENAIANRNAQQKLGTVANDAYGATGGGSGTTGGGYDVFTDSGG